MLTKRERVLASIRRKGIDAIPWQFDLTSKVIEKIKAYYNTNNLLEATEDHFVCTGSTAPRGYKEESLASGLVQNEFGVVWRRASRDINYGDWGELVSCPLKAPTLSGYDFPDGAAPGRWDHVEKLRKEYPDHFLMVSGHGLFESAWFLCGFQNYLGYLVSKENFVETLTEKLADFSCGVTAQLQGLGVDGIRFGDDWGFQDRLMMRAGIWRHIFKKHYRRIYETARNIGLVVMIHSCGNITEILPDLIEIGVQVVHPLQPEAMDVTHCQQEFGKDLTFWGGLGTQSTIPYGTPENNRKEVLQRLELFKKGGYILAPAGAISAESPVENVVAIIETATGQLDK